MHPTFGLPEKFKNMVGKLPASCVVPSGPFLNDFGSDFFGDISTLKTSIFGGVFLQELRITNFHQVSQVPFFVSTWGHQTATALMYSRKDGSGRRVITWQASRSSISVELSSLKLTVCNWKLGFAKGNFIFQPSIFRCYVSFTEVN